MMDDLKFILESGDNLSALLESGGLYIFIYLGFKAIMNFALGFFLIYAIYLVLKPIIAAMNANDNLNEITDSLDIEREGCYYERTHREVMSKIKQLKDK